MSANKVIIFGVTGVQGASVARALLTNPKFSVWGVTRNPASKSSQEMEKLGVNLIKGDLGDASSYADALKGAAGVFLNVNFWAHYKGNNADEARDIEMAQSNAAVDACKAAGVGLVVYSALESVGKFPIPHFDAKAEVVKYIKAQGVPATILYSSYYFTNLLSAKLEERGDEIVLKLPLPDDTVIPAFNPNQIGLFARLAFENPQEWTGKDMFACGENVRVDKIASVLSDLSSRKYVTMGVSRDDFLALPGEMDQELWLNYRAFVDGLMSRNPEESRKLVPEVQDFTTWVKADKDAVAKFGLRS
ncbi:hypothetical protein CcaverHIS002_0403140 [Cutaneotrichosporon cavernicola]|uniref:NmrA-like domain-containing protein n=1 Tax=Cutaneotrichosporon cavernicola TaxID=279322 RepID=A0AA48L3X1_9TREE|nr:uncharacterized protein CcaverHIS019_0403100 [Cutaneotrichosporon cavernicola]BEI83710.1 hypothetical protein CcaverHIS002_0403140 [Cutaneotrichosporon cavernicola]BEI91490.1 hypothetical protein CcaverHIS019_0403100 [Cutaneotrichosporon cavernicola]